MKQISLTEVQTAVLYMVVHGYSPKDIAERLEFREKELDGYLFRIYEKLATSGEADLLSLADRVASTSGVMRKGQIQNASSQNCSSGRTATA